MKSHEIMREYFKRQKANLYAIVNHPLEEAQEYTVILYFEMLAGLLQYEHVPQEEQLLFMERLLRGLGRPEELSDMMQKALEVEDSFAEDWVNQFKNNNLKYSFILDAMLLISSQGAPEKEQIDLLTELTVLLRLKHQEIDFLARLAVSILEEDALDYMKILEDKPLTIDMRQFFCYTKLFIAGRLVDDEEMTYYYAPQRTSFNKLFEHEEMAKESYEFKANEILIENWTIDLSEISWKFSNSAKVSFVNCEFIGRDKPMIFDGVNHIKVESCVFHAFDKRVFEINDCSQFELISSQFYNCLYVYNDSSSRVGGIYYIEDKGNNETSQEKSVKLFGCVFKACGIWNTHSDEYYYAPNNIIGFSEQIKQNISYSQFYNCLAYSKGVKEISGRAGTLFNNATSTDCELTASNKLH